MAGAGTAVFQKARAALKRFGPVPVKKWVLDFENRAYAEFLHDFDESYRSRINHWVESYCRGGSILDLGCSDGHVGFSLNPHRYSSYTGVDLSELAIERAIEAHRRAGRTGKNSFVVHDIFTYVPTRMMDVILFKDSIYYGTNSTILSCLNRLCAILTDKGVFIVHMDNIQRHQRVSNLIYKHFSVLEENNALEETGILMIFR